MNIIEAIKSGKRFKRKTWETYLLNCVEQNFTLKEVLADDWEVEPTPVTITREQFVEAWRNVFTFNEPYASLNCDALARELGL